MRHSLSEESEDDELSIVLRSVIVKYIVIRRYICVFCDTFHSSTGKINPVNPPFLALIPHIDYGLATLINEWITSPLISQSLTHFRNPEARQTYTRSMKKKKEQET